MSLWRLLGSLVGHFAPSYARCALLSEDASESAEDGRYNRQGHTQVRVANMFPAADEQALLVAGD